VTARWAKCKKNTCTWGAKKKTEKKGELQKEEVKGRPRGKKKKTSPLETPPRWEKAGPPSGGAGFGDEE